MGSHRADDNSCKQGCVWPGSATWGRVEGGRGICVSRSVESTDWFVRRSTLHYVAHHSLASEQQLSFREWMNGLRT